MLVIRPRKHASYLWLSTVNFIECMCLIINQSCPLSYFIVQMPITGTCFKWGKAGRFSCDCPENAPLSKIKLTNYKSGEEPVATNGWYEPPVPSPLKWIRAKKNPQRTVGTSLGAPTSPSPS